jgi:hypothetical protein
LKELVGSEERIVSTPFIDDNLLLDFSEIKGNDFNDKEMYLNQFDEMLRSDRSVSNNKQ